MDLSAFTREVAALALGKRMPDGVYAHVHALPYLPAELQAAVDAARALAGIDGEAFHVVKLARAGWRLSLGPRLGRGHADERVAERGRSSSGDSAFAHPLGRPLAP